MTCLKFFAYGSVGMPPNAKGGKGFKKKKKQSNDSEPIFIDRAAGQMPARAIRLLGNRNVLCYSNDNVLRMCHICGKMKGRVFIEPGDVVLITLRDFMVDASPAQLKAIKMGDIVGKYAPEQFNSLKAEAGVNPKLFMKIESSGGCSVSEIGADYTDTEIKVTEDLGFEFEGSESDESEEHVTSKEKITHRPTRPELEEEINIDDI